MKEKLDTNTFEFKVTLHSGKLCLLFQLTTLAMKKFILGELDVKKTKIKKYLISWGFELGYTGPKTAMVPP